MISTFERIMMPLAGRISSNKYLLAMRDSFSMLLPFIIVGSFFGIMEWVVLDPWGTIMGENGMNLGATLTGLTGDAYKASGFVATLQALQGLCNNVVTVGFGCFSFLLVGAFAYRLAQIWGGDPFSTALTAFGAFIIVTPQQIIGKAGDRMGAFSLDYFGNKAVLTAIIVATVTAWLFVKLSKNEKFRIKMPDTVPPAVAQSFAVLVPVLVTLSVFTIFATILSQCQFLGKAALNDLIYALIQAPLMGFSQGIGFSILYAAALKRRKGDVEINLNVVVTPNSYCFDKLRDDHLLRFKGTAIVEIRPAKQPIIFFAEFFCGFRQRSIFLFRRRYSVFELENGILRLRDERVQKVNTQRALSTNHFQSLTLIISKFFLFLYKLIFRLLEFDPRQFDLSFVLLSENLRFFCRCNLSEFYADCLFYNTVQLCDCIS